MGDPSSSIVTAAILDDQRTALLGITKVLKQSLTMVTNAGKHELTTKATSKQSTTGA